MNGGGAFTGIGASLRVGVNIGNDDGVSLCSFCVTFTLSLLACRTKAMMPPLTMPPMMPPPTMPIRVMAVLLVGSVVGLSVGRVVGSAVGRSVGRLVGAALGAGVGADVGLSHGQVGAGVGAVGPVCAAVALAVKDMPATVTTGLVVSSWVVTAVTVDCGTVGLRRAVASREPAANVTLTMSDSESRLELAATCVLYSALKAALSLSVRESSVPVKVVVITATTLAVGARLDGA